jgi:hypothetical protein
VKHTHNEEIHDLKPMHGPLHKISKGTMQPHWNIKKIRTAYHSSSSVTEASQAAKLELANAGNDLSVSSISKLANYQAGAQSR